jgi:8-oxo-dGTP pyrophosphatase MutT (NUDIX family)
MGNSLPVGADPASSEALDAGTVVLLRDAAGGLETLMLRRNSRLDFVGGMWVFPGGRVDLADREGAADALAAARRAAAREAREEAGLELHAQDLLPFAHWTPPPVIPRRFLTWFFVAAAPAGRVVVDGGEIHEHAWMRPAQALRRRDAHEIELAPPTWVSLHWLAGFARTADALESARRRPPEFFATRIARLEGDMLSLWHGDAGYDTGDPLAPGPRHRLWMGRTGWRYERTV